MATEELNRENKALKKHKAISLVIALLPLAALAVLFIIYLILLSVNSYDIGQNLTSLLNQSIVLILVATGAIFIFTLGSFDISLGANVLFSATIGVLAYNATGNVFVLFAASIGIAVLSSLLTSTLSSLFRLPMFVTTVAMLSVLAAFATLLINTNGSTSGTTVSIRVLDELLDALNALDNVWFKLIIIGIFMAICIFVFMFTKIGRRQKFIGGNPICARMTGISDKVYGIIAFVMAGIGVGLGASMTVVYAQSVSTSTASSIGMTVFIAIVFGGMPISGGARSRIYAALIGGFSYMLLHEILFILFSGLQDARDGYIQLVSAIMFLIVVFVAGFNYRSKNLPR